MAYVLRSRYADMSPLSNGAGPHFSFLIGGFVNLINIWCKGTLSKREEDDFKCVKGAKEGPQISRLSADFAIC